MNSLTFHLSIKQKSFFFQRVSPSLYWGYLYFCIIIPLLAFLKKLLCLFWTITEVLVPKWLLSYLYKSILKHLLMWYVKKVNIFNELNILGYPEILNKLKAWEQYKHSTLINAWRLCKWYESEHDFFEYRYYESFFPHHTVWATSS